MSTRRTAILWFVAAGLSLIAAVLSYIGEGRIRWPVVAATFFLAAMGFSALRRSGSGGV